MEALRALWIDLTVSTQGMEPPAEFRRSCEFSYCSEIKDVDRFIEAREANADIICFDFDYPDRRRLALLRSVKVGYPSLPVVMFTVQHSEALAIWAFRTKVWDYLVKPVAEREAQRCLTSLSRALQRARGQERRATTIQTENMPPEIPFQAAPDDYMLAPALQYVERNYQSRILSEDLAAHCGLSVYRFSRLFKEVFGLTFRDYLINYRLREAHRLLENPMSTVADVSFAVGFSDPSYFARIFKQRVGVAPSSLIGRSRDDTNIDLTTNLPVVKL